MGKFLGKVLILLILLGILLAGANFAYVHTEYYKNLNNLDNFAQIPEHIDIVNLGNSHSYYGFVWTGNSFTGFNMALPSQTIVYDEMLLNEYFDRLNEDSTVVLAISFRSLYEENSSMITSQVTRYYRVLSKRTFTLWDWKDAIIYKYIPVLGNRATAMKMVISEWFNENQPETTERLPWNGWEFEAIEALGKVRAEEFMEKSGTQELGDQYQALIRILEKCKEADVQVILVTMPTLSCFYNSFTEDFKLKFYADMEDIFNQYGVRYLDYTGDPRFEEDWKIFNDTDHLTEEGAKLFTNVFLTDNADILWFVKE